MLSVYNYMASGVLLTGVVAMLFASSGLAYQILAGPGILKYVIMFAPLLFVMTMSFGINRLSRSEEHTSELQSLMRISYAVFCLKKKNNVNTYITHNSQN